MTPDEVRKKFIELLKWQFGDDMPEVNDGTRFAEDLAADSLDMVELVMEAEDHFEITIADEDAEQLATVGAAVEYLTKAVAGGQ